MGLCYPRPYHLPLGPAHVTKSLDESTPAIRSAAVKARKGLAVFFVVAVFMDGPSFSRSPRS